MKLDSGKVRLITPFWPTLFGRTLRFTGRRNTVHLQETALVAEGEILLFQCFGLERLFGRVLSAWSTVTVPYSRIVSMRYHRRWLLRSVILAVMLLIPISMMELPRTKVAEWTSLHLVADLLIVVPFLLVGGLVWWGIPASYSLRFRSKEGKRIRFHFRIRSRASRIEFEESMRQYRQAAREYARAGGES